METITNFLSNSLFRYPRRKTPEVIGLHITMSPACSHAVGLPEIVAAILEQLDNAKALFAALQVNKLWADEATTLLWRVDPPILALARIEDAERLQYYADKISSLYLRYFENEDDAYKNQMKLRSLRFPRLNRLRTEQPGGKDEQVFLKYLQPNLRTFEPCGLPMSKFLMEQIQERCPALRSLWIDNQHGRCTTDDLLQFLNGMPSLTSICLIDSREEIISDEVFVHLASRPNLAALCLYPVLKLSFINGMQDMVDQPLPELVYLRCWSESKAFSQLSHYLTSLTDLDLRLVDAASKTVFDICSCTSLVNLSLDFDYPHFDAKSNFPPECLLALAKSCPQLQDLKVMHSRLCEVDGGDTTNITDDVIQDFVTLLPGLSCLNLTPKTSLTYRALEILGNGCANLKECRFEGKSFNLRLLESNGPVLFPQLEFLALKPTEEGLSAAMAIERFLHHAPRINVLALANSHWDARDA
ncbi:hypothetical protein HO173_008138 [Letharia columbiana]|uniref:F-box domain-containing protein n=1 Tax=Letharia columbiana TaxID=112416 RepID=A0A8H6L2Z1_9LECA|nr:uncharacterized protein HO173_008138 [Letharia columbiana]KAF6233581.1 hypothetical protein HO173_008138 [Letharia columbiana]